ncbi:protein RST1 [Cornus florida]|uniref:protein RST1 n=1 Tax=Cornus florida TaxID=4283 RepID=UPI0028A23AA3|nr:protein RST1 [Cornus florida]
MDSYSSLLERTRVPQPSLQRFAVISIFEKLRSAPPHLNSDSGPGREVLTQCLHSTSPAVIDQSVRELCRLVKDSKLELPRGLLELQSALEGSDSRFVSVFVKGLGFFVRLGFQKNSSSFRFQSSEKHPFVKVLSCRNEVQSELVKQVLLFMVHNKRLGMEEVCEFLRPFLNFSILKVHSSASMSLFARNLITSMASFCCSFPLEAIPVLKLLMGYIKYVPCKNAEDFNNISYIMEYTVDAYTIVLTHLVRMELLVFEAQLCGVELLETILSCTEHHKHSDGHEVIFDISKRLLSVQKELSLSYIHELSSAILSLFMALTQSELEHEQLSILRLLLFLLKWKNENEYVVDSAACDLNEEILLIFPIINLIASPSKPVKQAATDLLSMLEKLLINLLITPKKKLTMPEGFPSITRPKDIVFRLLQHLWFQDQHLSSSSFYLNFASTVETDVKEIQDVPKTWTSILREYSQWIVERQKSSSISRSQEIFLTELPLLLGTIASVLIMHHKLGDSAVDILAVSGIMDPKLGVPLLLSILFYNNIFSGKDKDIDFHDTSFKLLGILPSLASHSVMIPLIVQTILPMLHKDAKPVLYATATRLLCKTWEINDRIFGSLQGLLLPKGFTQFITERNICISMAVSIRDVCRKNPDRGVDLILSVSACIESQDPIIQALGLQSLAHLCEADVIDFYTAWDVIAKNLLDHLENPVVAHGLCFLLRWGAMDAEAYPEAAMNVLQILWEVGTSRQLCHGSLWVKARASAFEALAHYEVPHIQESIPDFKKRNMKLLIYETDPEVLRTMEGFEVKIITHEHITRRRLVKERRVSGNKIEKLVDVFPQVIFSKGNNSRAKELPGAALFCLSFTPKDLNNQGASEGLQDLQARYENALEEIAASLPLSRNILISLLSLQSWKPFMHRWMRAHITFLDAKFPSTMLDKTSKAANDILKRMRRIAEESIPRSAENIALAIGALCAVLPPSAHVVKSTASKFLLNWLFQYEHEYRQWSAAMSLGLISSCLHLTDHKQKFQNINSLIEVASRSKSVLVKGACGVGLGFSCQGLLTRVESADGAKLDKESFKNQEADLLFKIVGALSQMISQFSHASYDVLQSLSAYFPLDTVDIDSDMTSNLSVENCDDLEEDIWGVAGLVLGLGSSVGAIYRAGAHDDVLKIKALIMSWIPHVNPSLLNSSISEKFEMVLSVGSCLALPIIVAFCQRVELMDDVELDHLLRGYRELISELLFVTKSGTFYQSLLMASCIGAGSLLACILNEGVHSMEVERVKDLLALFRKSYSNPHPPLIHFGGMLGVINALGAGAGKLFHDYPSKSLHNAYDLKESSYIMGPLLSNPVLEPDLTLLIQEMFLVAQNSEDCQLQQYAAWSISFLRHGMWSREVQKIGSNFQSDAVDLKSVSQSFPEESVVMQLSLWLMHLNYIETSTVSHINTVATALRCLSQAPRLPEMDWAAIIRRCMKYEGQVTDLLPPDSVLKEGILRDECLQFSLAHAVQFDSLLSFLDELYDLPRFRTLEPNLQSFMLLHLADLIKLFSGSRLEKLFDDVADFLSCLVSSSDVYNPEQKSLLRISCWKGLCLCMDEAPVGSQEYILNMEHCMELLFSSLPVLHATVVESNQVHSVEWSEAIGCLGKARQSWLSDLLQVSEVDLIGDTYFSKVVKKIQARAKLVCVGSVPLSELGKLKAYLLNNKSHGIWDVLVEVVAALQHAEGSVKRQWLLDAVEISCVTKYPSTTLQFLGLLCGSCSKYMPLLIVDPLTVLSDLPITLTSLLSDTSWGVAVESVVSYLWVTTERILDWATRIAHGDNSPTPQPIDESENSMAIFLMQVMHRTCVYLRNYLSPEKQLRLANMVVPEFQTVQKM